MNQHAKNSILAPCNVFGKLCLLIMATHLQKTIWTCTDLQWLTGVHLKRVRRTVVDLHARSLINLEMNERNAYEFSLNLDELEKVAEEYAFNLPMSLKPERSAAQQ